MPRINLQINANKKFDPLKNRTIIYIFSLISIIGYLLDIIFIELQNTVYYLNCINILISIIILILFYLKKAEISFVVKVNIIALLANLLISSFFNPVDGLDYTNMFIRNSFIMFMFIPVYGLYCGKYRIFDIGIVFLILYLEIIIRSNNPFLNNNAPILIFGAVIYHIAFYYIFDALEKMQKSQIELNKSLESQKDQLIIKNNDLEQKNQYINKQAVELKQMLATKEKLFSIIAHDLRSPFNIILGYSAPIDDQDNMASEYKQNLDLIHSSAKKTLNLLDNLLNWAKSQTGELSYKPKKINLSDLIFEIIELNDTLAKAKNISLNYSLLDEIEVYTDENMLKTILRNLISNAIKFTNIGGKVDFSAILRQNEVEILVSDNGVGMNKETINKLFKIDSAITTIGTSNEIGSGLGLIICKEFAEILGGKIWVESQEGKGSDFKFTLPLYQS